MLYLLYALLFLIALVLIIRFIAARKKHQAAANVLFGKFTFDKLAKKEQQKVHKAAVSMVINSSLSTRGFANDIERYGWYALAMKSLSISSAVPDNPNWYDVKNPYTAVTAGDKMLYRISSALNHHYSIDIDPASLLSKNAANTL